MKKTLAPDDIVTRLHAMGNGLERGSSEQRDIYAAADSIKRLTRDLKRATDTLTVLGYTDNGGELWRPALGPNPSPLLDKIDALTRELEQARRELESARSHMVEDINRLAAWREVGEALECALPILARSDLCMPNEYSRAETALAKAREVDK